MEEQATVTEVLTTLERFERALDDKLEVLAKSFISWKAMAVMILPLMAGTSWGMVQYHARQADQRMQSAIGVQAGAVEKVENEVDELNEKIDVLNINMSEQSKAIERLSTAIEYMGNQIERLNASRD